VQCFIDFCAQNSYINNASDVYIGYIAWGAGSLGSNYLLDLTPSRTGTKWTDMPMAVSCVIDVWATAAAVVTPVWGLALATANVSTMTSSSASSTLTGTATKGSNGGSAGSQTSLSGGYTKTINPGSSSTGQNSASGVKVGGGLMMGSLLLALTMM
jgi:endoglucanase